MEVNKKLNINQKLIITSGFVFIILLSSLLTFSLSVLILQVLFGSITLLFTFNTNYKIAKLWLNIFLVSMIFVFLVYVANQFFYGKPYFNGGSDDLRFEEWGYAIYNYGIYNPSKIMDMGIIGQFNNSTFYSVFIARLMQASELFGGYSTYLPRIVNVYLLLWICMITRYLLQKYAVLSERTVFYSIVFFAFMPNIQFINAHVFRDTFNLFQVLLIALLFDFLISKKVYLFKIISILFLPYVVYSTYYTRAGSIIFAGILLLLMISSLYRIKTIYVIVIVTSVLLFSNILEIFNVENVIGGYSSYLSYMASDGLSRFVFNRPLLPFGIFFRAIYALISPFPNFFGLFKNSSRILFDVIQFLRATGVLLQIVFIPFIIKRSLKLDWLSLLFISWFLAVISTTFTFRHFLLYYPFMAAIGIDGYINTKIKERKIILISTIFITLCCGIIYMSLKFFL